MIIYKAKLIGKQKFFGTEPNGTYPIGIYYLFDQYIDANFRVFVKPIMSTGHRINYINFKSIFLEWEISDYNFTIDNFNFNREEESNGVVIKSMRDYKIKKILE